MSGVPPLRVVVLELWHNDRLLGRRTAWRPDRRFDEGWTRELAERELRRLRLEFETRHRARPPGRRYRVHFSARVFGPSGVYVRIEDGPWERVSVDEDRSLEPCRALAAAVVRNAVEDLRSGSDAQRVAAARFLLSDLWQTENLWGDLLRASLRVEAVKRKTRELIATSDAARLIYQEVPEARPAKAPA